MLAVSPPWRQFPGRKGGLPSEFIMDVRGAASNLALRGILLGALADGLSCFPLNSVVGGIKSGGLVLGAMLALVVSREFVTVLPEGPRASGLQRAVEGSVLHRDVVLFDNVVSTGKSLVDASSHVAGAGGKAVGALVVGSYDAPPELPFPIISLLTLTDLVEAAHEVGLISTARRNQIVKS